MRFPVRIPFVEQLGFELLRMGEGEAEIAVTLSEGLCNSFKVAHGGLTMTLLDAVMAHAARSVGVSASPARSVGVSVSPARSVGVSLGPARSEDTDTDIGAADLGPGVVTIEMKTSFMRPGEGRLTGRGKLLHRSATLAFCEGSVFAADGALCAHATATFKYLRALPRGRDVLPLQRRPGDSGSD
ncbi:PaaI family thioesterase [Methylibium sp.]|uniref:PaaI family thioesterase n=1 Tax=Methylibium sp. TaxID=2067992 RepID=UPI00286A89C1|nr:PaaI family thioesterase [Methylibium sp.]